MSEVRGAIGAGLAGIRSTGESVDGLPATVQTGETKLAEVAKRLNVDLEALIQANPQLTDLNHLKAGQDIRLPQTQTTSKSVVDAAYSGPVSAQQDGVGTSLPAGDPMAKSMAQLKFKPASTGQEELMGAGDAKVHTSRDLDLGVKRAALETLRQLLPTTSPAYRAVVNLIVDDRFIELDVATQMNLLAGLGDKKSDPALSKDVTALVASKEFNQLGPAARARFAQNFTGLEPADRAAAMKLLQRPDIAALPTAIKDAVTAAASKAPADMTTIDALVKRANDPVFKKLPADAQEAFFRAFEYQHDTIEMDPALTNKESLLKLVDSAAFRKLDATAQSRWMQALGSADPIVRDRSYARLADLVQKTVDLPEATKVDRLSSRASALDAEETVRTDRKELPGASKKPPLISAAQADARSVFFSADGKGIDPKKANVLVHTVTIEGKQIEVIYPRPMPKDMPSVELIAKGLAGLPATERAHVTQVIVDPRFKSYMQGTNAKDGRPNRIFMGGEAPDNQREMTAMLSHEAAHLLAADQFKAHPEMLKRWEAAIKNDNHRVSDYATTSLQEDVAETIALYYQVKGTPDEAGLKRDFPNRYAIIKDLLGEA